MNRLERLLQYLPPSDPPKPEQNAVGIFILPDGGMEMHLPKEGLRLVYREDGLSTFRLPEGKEKGEELLARLAAAIAGPPKGSK